MKSNYTKKQIEKAICKWTSYLLENNMATEFEMKQLIAEGLFKRAKTGIKNIFKGATHGISSVIKATGIAIHDAFAANSGVKDMLTAVKALIQKGKKASAIRLFVCVDDNNYPCAKFALSKNRKTLALVFDDSKKKKPLTFEDLFQFLKENSIVSKGRKISDFIDSICCGKLSDNNINAEDLLAESIKSKDIERIQKVIISMGWSKNTAKSKAGRSKLMALFNIKDTPENVDSIKDAINQAFDTKNDTLDDSPLEKDEESKDDDSKDKNSKDEDSKNNNNDKSNDNDESKDEPDFSKNEPKITINKDTNFALKTKNGEIIAMTNKFEKAEARGSDVGMFFGLSKKAKKDAKDIEDALG